MRKILSSILVFLSGLGLLYAQSEYAYVYIEGDQETPFYVKVEGKMHPRLGKNHFIISNLDKGYTKFEILFQQNKYPPQEFLLEVPASGSRGFTLHKINDRQFALYDLQQKRYIVSGNTEEDGAAPVLTGSQSPVGGKTRITDTEEVVEEDITEEPETAVPETEKQQFVPGLTLNNDGTYSRLPDFEPTAPSVSSEGHKKKQKRKPENFGELPAWDPDAATVQEDEENAAETEPATTQPAVSGDCTEAMDNLVFESFALRILEKSNDNDRFKLLKKQKKKHCFSTEQVRILVKNLNMQSIRFDAVEMLYEHTSDPENYGQLESLFNTDYLKNKFKSLLE